MKGIVFGEFMEMVEATFGDETVDMMVEQNNLASGGVYTAVGQIATIKNQPTSGLMHPGIKRCSSAVLCAENS